jgi:Fe-S-cluster containining protein
MGNRELPVLNFGPFRKYPTRKGLQHYDDEAKVCGDCLSGACCTTEDAIYLTSFDIFRLAAYFDMSPATFMLTFTQDKFDHEDSAETRRPSIDDPDCSIVTYLRRRDNNPTSPCIFLKYIREPDGTPRRVCSVHDARPLSCREYYFDVCKTRHTGEVAAVISEGYEKVGAGELTEEMADAALARQPDFDAEKASLAAAWEHSFWAEMKLVLNMETVNGEGANSYDIAAYQDPIDDKLNRVLSAKYLRFEEKYGARPRDEQLMPYSTGLRFVASADYARLMAIVQTPPVGKFFELGSYPNFVGVRTMLSGVRHAELLPIIPAEEADAFLASIPSTALFPSHRLAAVRSITLRDIYAAVLKGINHLIRFCNRLFVMEDLLEWEMPGRFEFELLMLASSLRTSLNAYIADNPYLRQAIEHIAGTALDWIERLLDEAGTGNEIWDIHRFVSTVDPAILSNAAPLAARFALLTHKVKERLQEAEYDLHLSDDNGVLTRLKSGQRLNSKKAWRDWGQQVLDARYLHLINPGAVDLNTIYRTTVAALEQIPPRRSYAYNLHTVIVNTAFSMTFDNRIPYPELPDQATAARLAVQAMRLFNWLEEDARGQVDGKVAAAFPVLYKGLGLGYNRDESFGLIVQRILTAQLPDGSWDTNPLPDGAPGTQAEYYRRMYQLTGAYIDALRPLKGDARNSENADLQLS